LILNEGGNPSAKEYRKGISTEPSILMGFLNLQKARLSCQNQLGLSGRKRGRYGLEIVAFQTLKNATVIADSVPQIGDYE